MPFQILKADLVALACDAVVNPTDEVLSGSGGLDAQLHRAAGPELARACAALSPLSPGEAVLSAGYGLRCRHVIHTVAPWWSGREEELALLRRCYRSALRLSEEAGLRRVAFPLIGSGTRGFPKELVLRVAAEELMRGLREDGERELLLVVHDRSEFRPDPALLDELGRYIRDVHADLSRTEDAAPFSVFSESFFDGVEAPSAPAPSAARDDRPASRPQRPQRRRAALASLPLESAAEADRRFVLDESFSQMVMRKIAERGFRKDSDCYTRANIDRRLFSRLRCDAHYHPKKTTALALAVALELTLDETKELLGKAGYTLSHSLLPDVIVEYCIRSGVYDIFEINELLFEYDQPLLGG